MSKSTNIIITLCILALSIIITGCSSSDNKTIAEDPEIETIFIEGVIQRIEDRVIHINMYDDNTRELYAPEGIMLPKNISPIPFEFECYYDENEEQWIIVNMGVLE